jgi:hypothetical protein
VAVLEVPRRPPRDSAGSEVETKPSRPATGSRFPSGMFLAKGSPPPFVVARGEDPFKVFDEALKHTRFFERLEELLLQSGKRREAFEIVAKVDFLNASRKEENPVSYVDPRLVSHLFNQLLDRGFRLLRVVEKRNDISRYQRCRSVKEVGQALGYDESCYELRDLADELWPVDFGDSLGLMPTGRTWKNADCRIVIAKNRSDEMFGPALLFYNLVSSLAVPTNLVLLERGVELERIVLGSMQTMPAHFGIVEALYSRDGTPGEGGAYELLTDPEGHAPEKGAVHKTDTIIAGQDFLAVEAAGEKMQGFNPLDSEILKLLRRTTGYRLPTEIDDLPTYPGWQSLGLQIREILDVGKPAEAYRYGLHQVLQEMDPKVFPRQPGGWAHVHLREKAETYLEEVQKQRGGSVAAADLNGSA